MAEIITVGGSSNLRQILEKFVLKDVFLSTAIKMANILFQGNTSDLIYHLDFTLVPSDDSNHYQCIYNILLLSI